MTGNRGESVNVAPKAYINENVKESVDYSTRTYLLMVSLRMQAAYM